MCVWLTLERTRPGPGYRTGHSTKVGACPRDPDHKSRDTHGSMPTEHAVRHGWVLAKATRGWPPTRQTPHARGHTKGEG